MGPPVPWTLPRTAPAVTPRPPHAPAASLAATAQGASPVPALLSGPHFLICLACLWLRELVGKRACFYSVHSMKIGRPLRESNLGHDTASLVHAGEQSGQPGPPGHTGRDRVGALGAGWKGSSRCMEAGGRGGTLAPCGNCCFSSELGGPPRRWSLCNARGLATPRPTWPHIPLDSPASEPEPGVG